MLPRQEQLFDSFLDKIASNKEITGLKTGIAEVDELIGGLEHLVILGGKTGSGKTSLATQIALNLAQNERVPVLFFTFEMNSDDILTMMVQSLSQKSLERGQVLRTEENDSIVRQNVERSLDSLKNIINLIHIYDSKAGIPTLEAIENEIKNIQAHHQTNEILVIIDSFNDLVAASGQLVISKAEEEVIEILQQIQIRTGSTMLAIAQKINNSLRGSSEDGLKGSVALYHKPTTVLELISYKELLSALEQGTYSSKREKLEIEEMLKNPNISTPTMLYVSKHRNNTNSRIYLKFYGSYRIFEAGLEPAFENRNQFRVYNYLEQ